MFGLAILFVIKETAFLGVISSHSTVLHLTVMEAIVELLLHPIIMEPVRLIPVVQENVLVQIRNIGVLVLGTLLDQTVK